MKRTALLLASMALAVLLACGVAQAQTTVVDQENAATTAKNGKPGLAVEYEQGIAQSFTPSKSGDLDSVALYHSVFEESYPSRGNLFVHVNEADQSTGAPTSLLGWAMLYPNQVPLGGGWVTVAFDGEQPVNRFPVTGLNERFIADSSSRPTLS